jgi:hypothetical protein
MTYEQLKLMKRLIEETIAKQNRYDTQAIYRAESVFKELAETVDQSPREEERGATK